MCTQYKSIARFICRAFSRNKHLIYYCDLLQTGARTVNTMSFAIKLNAWHMNFVSFLLLLLLFSFNSFDNENYFNQQVDMRFEIYCVYLISRAHDGFFLGFFIKFQKATIKPNFEWASVVKIYIWMYNGNYDIFFVVVEIMN